MMSLVFGSRVGPEANPIKPYTSMKQIEIYYSHGEHHPPLSITFALPNRVPILIKIRKMNLNILRWN